MALREGEAAFDPEHRNPVSCRRGCGETCWVRIEGVVQEYESLRQYIDRFKTAYASDRPEPALSHLFHEIRRFDIAADKARKGQKRR